MRWLAWFRSKRELELMMQQSELFEEIARLNTRHRGQEDTHRALVAAVLRDEGPREIIPGVSWRRCEPTRLAEATGEALRTNERLRRADTLVEQMRYSLGGIHTPEALRPVEDYIDDYWREYK